LEGNKLPSTTPGYAIVRISHLDDAFSGILKLDGGLGEGQQLWQKDKKKEKSFLPEKNWCVISLHT